MVNESELSFKLRYSKMSQIRLIGFDQKGKWIGFIGSRSINRVNIIAIAE